MLFLFFLPRGHHVHGVRIDDKGRRLIAHEAIPNVRALGHTISKHVNKSPTYLANRCKSLQYSPSKPNNATTYLGLKDASEYIRDLIKRDQEKINRLALSSNRPVNFYITSNSLSTNIDTADSYGVSCLFYNNSYWVNFFGNKFYLGPQGFEYPRYKIVIKRKLNQPGHWFLNTSYPYRTGI